MRDALHPRRLRDRPGAADRRRRPRRPRLHGPRHELDAGRQPRARASPTPTTRRWTCGWTPTRSSPPTRSSTRGSAAGSRARSGTTARSASPTGSRARSSAAAPATSSTTTFELNEAITAAIPAPARFAGGHPAKRTFQAIRIAVNGELQQLDEALPLAWDVLKIGGRFAALSFHSLEDRRVKRFLADKARGCICPPDLPICVCGNTPEAELVHRRSIVATPGEVAANPRSKSARLRAARKLSEVRIAQYDRHTLPSARTRAGSPVQSAARSRPARPYAAARPRSSGSRGSRTTGSSTASCAAAGASG